MQIKAEYHGISVVFVAHCGLVGHEELYAVPFLKKIGLIYAAIFCSHGNNDTNFK